MLINSDCTIYRRIYDPSIDCDTWQKQYVPECWWFVEAKSTITTEGLKSADVLKVRIPDLSVVVKKDDVILQGKCDIDMKSVKDLSGLEYFKVTSANYNRFGNNPHIKVVGV